MDMRIIREIKRHVPFGQRYWIPLMSLTTGTQSQFLFVYFNSAYFYDVLFFINVLYQHGITNQSKKKVFVVPMNIFMC